MTSGTARDALYARLRDVLGENDARTMMELLPPGDFGALASREDIGGIETRMGRFEERMDRLDTRMDHLEERMDRFETSMERFDDRLHDFHTALREQTRTLILASTTSALTVGAMAFAAARLV